VFFGAIAAGSALWGQLASMLGLPAAYFIAAAAALLGIALTWRWKLLSGAGVDLAPSMQWPAPVLAIDADADRGPAFDRRVPRQSGNGRRWLPCDNPFTLLWFNNP
jgi:hypothetical protein